jgi:hypothetical protein
LAAERRPVPPPALEARNIVAHRRTRAELRPVKKKLQFRIACPPRLVITTQIKPAIVTNLMFGLLWLEYNESF